MRLDIAAAAVVVVVVLAFEVSVAVNTCLEVQFFHLPKEKTSVVGIIADQRWCCNLTLLREVTNDKITMTFTSSLFITLALNNYAHS